MPKKIWIKKTNRKRLEKLVKEMKKTYIFMEKLVFIWRKKKAPDYMKRQLSEAQEQVAKAKRKIEELLGSL